MTESRMRKWKMENGPKIWERRHGDGISFTPCLKRKTDPWLRRQPTTDSILFFRGRGFYSSVVRTGFRTIGSPLLSVKTARETCGWEPATVPGHAASGNITALNPPDHWQGRRVLSVTCGPDDALWIGTEGAGLYRFDNGRWTNFGQVSA